jgi:hypothetical protein
MDLFTDLNAHYQIGRTLFELGEVAAAQMNTVKARNYFTGALEAFESMQAIPDISRTKAVLVRLI